MGYVIVSLMDLKLRVKVWIDVKIISASVEQMTPYIDGVEFLKTIERAGRVCYKSEDKITDTYTCPNCGYEGVQYFTTGDVNVKLCIPCGTPLTFSGSAVMFVRRLIKNGHEAMIEHAPSISMKFICDRGVSHEIVRHRLFSFAQESTRYCNYGHGNEITVIDPCFWPDGVKPSNFTMYDCWVTEMLNAERAYLGLLNDGATPQEARSVLPNSLKTEIVVTGNLREWRHFFKLRTAKSAHPQMRKVALMALTMLKEQIPVVFEDIIEEK